MSEVKLAHKYSAETYEKALNNIVKRSDQNSDGGPIKYDDAAIGMDGTTASTALKFLSEIGLLESPKAGHYLVPEEVSNYVTKMGAVQEAAKSDVEQRLTNYELYNEAKFIIETGDYHIDDLVTEVGGSSKVAADKDELKNVERSLRIIDQLGFLEIDDDGLVSVPQLGSDTGADEAQVSNQNDGEVETQVVDDESKHGGIDEAKMPHDIIAANQPYQASSGLSIELEISMDLTDMDAEEAKEKLKIVNSALT